MAKPYSMDLRERVVARVEAGETVRKVAVDFAVSVSAVVKWSQRYRETGSVAPAKFGGWRRPILEPHADFIRARLAEAPELALRSLQAELAENGVKVSYGALWAFVHAQGLSFKTTAFACEQERPDVARKRAQWRTYQARVNPNRLVFIDETWAKTNMAPLRGWSTRGKRLIGRAPHGRSGAH